MSQTSKVNLGAIMFRVQFADDWTLVFTEESPIGGRPTRFILHRSKHSGWAFSFCDGWNDPICSRIQAAYQWAIARVGDDFQQERKPWVEKPQQHKWGRDPKQRRAVCVFCGSELNDLTRYATCTEPSLVGDTL